MKKETKGLTTTYRRRCSKGHKLRVDRGPNAKFCQICYNTTKYYYERVVLGLRGRQLTHYGNLDTVRANTRKAMRRYTDRWSRPNQNLYDREMKNIGKHLGLNNKAEVEEWLTKNPTPHFAGDL